MKIQYASDLHLEMQENTDWIRKHPLRCKGDILVLAGDIAYLDTDDYIHHRFWDRVSKAFRQVYVVPGNHEFYNYYDLGSVQDGMEITVRDNVNVCYNKVIRLEDTDLILTPLWSHIKAENAQHVQTHVNDFYRIRYHGGKLTAAYFNREHERCLGFLKKALAESTAPHKVIVTHHVPSVLLVDPCFKNSPLENAFTVDLTGFIEASGADYWIYGHSHRNIDRIIGKTRCVTNQLGYVFMNEQGQCRNDAVIEI